MATPKQRKLAKALIENAKADKPKSGLELAESSGYSVKTAEGGMSRIIEQKGVQEVFKQLGFTKENAAKVVSGILNNEEERPEVRLRASDQVFKVTGAYVPEVAPPGGLIVNNFFSSPAVKSAIENAEEVIKSTLYVETNQEAPPAVEAD